MAYAKARSREEDMMQPFDAVNAPLEQGITLIEASAGTGKTYSIATLFLRLVLEERVGVQSILAVTYTVAATQELRERIRARIHAALGDLRDAKTVEPADPVVSKFVDAGGDRKAGIRDLELAEQSFDDARIFTIHGFCQRILQDHAFESGSRYGCELLTDAKPLLEEVAHDFWRNRFYASPLAAALAMARGESPKDWVTLLEGTRNHPDLVILPQRESISCEDCAGQIEAALETLRAGWIRDQQEIEQILRFDKALLRGEKTFRLDRVERLLGALERLVVAGIDTESVEAIKAFSRSEIIAGTGKKKTSPGHAFFDQCEEFRNLAERYFRQLTHEFLDFAAKELPARKSHRNVVTFDDLLTQVHRALQDGNGETLASAIGGKYRAALIDEFQDTDPLQYAIFQKLFGKGLHWLFFIGDPKQAIYGFRGADVFTYLKAAKSAARRYTLTTNWRSDEALLAGFNPLFLGREKAFVVDAIDYHEVHSSQPEMPAQPEPPLQFRYLRDNDPGEKSSGLSQEDASRKLTETVAGDLAALHRTCGGPWEWGDMAVLVRTHWQVATVQKALRQHGIRSVLRTEESVFHSAEAVEIQRLLEAVLVPGKNSGLHAALATPLLGLDGNRIATLTTEEHQQWLERFLAWRDQWRNGCFIAMFRRMLVDQDVRRRLMEWPGGERRLTNVLHLSELLHEAESVRRFTPEALCEWLGEQRVAERPSSDASQLRLESDGDAVTIVTVHKSKGLEYSVVLCPFLWLPADSPRRDRVQFHDDADRLTLDLRGKKQADPEHVERHGREALAEEVRLLYVAVTRAKQRCVIYAGDIRGADDSALGHLLVGETGGLLGGMERLAEEHPEAVALSQIESGLTTPEDVQAPLTSVESSSGAGLLATREFPGTLRFPAFLTSFSGLTAGSGFESSTAGLPVAADLPVDDHFTEKPVPAQEAILTNAAEEETEAGRLLHFVEARDREIFRFERGTRAGDFFHDVLEHLDFQNPSELDLLLPAKLGLHGFSITAQMESALKAKLLEVLDVELVPGLSLNKIRRKDRLSEVEFSFRLNSLEPGDLGDIFSDFATAVLDPQELGRLRFSPVEGFLRGFIDLLFVHEGRFYVVDWKSNWLGSTLEDYDPPGVQAAMRHHHYALQAHLYVLAVDRFLANRLPDYDYERHFGGVFYLFLRGVERGNPQRAIFRDRPAMALVTILRRLTD